MRVITGKIKGMNLFSPSNMNIRPTSDRVKESVFNILGHNFVDATVLDLFAGSGSLTLEAYSRGAIKLYAVENHKDSLALLKKNLAKGKATNYVKVYPNDAVRSIKYFFEQNIQFDFIFADPPYNKGYIQSLLKELEEFSVLAPKGIIILEHNLKELIDVEYLNKLLLFRQEKYGDTMVSFIKNK